jgi:iron complex outermembrane receptor protein
MSRKLYWTAAPIALLIGSVVHAQTAPQKAPGVNVPAAAQPSASELEAVVVTASRREVSIRQTPIAVSSYSGDKLQVSHIESFVDLVPSSPNIQLGSNLTNQDITIRGVGHDLTNVGSDPGVSFSVDGVYLAQTGLATSTFLDVSRVEVLRGPQGTLFGRNATGGAVNVITNAPTNAFSYGMDASVGFGPIEDHVDGFVSGPLTSDGKLLGRLAVQQTYNDGFTKNLSETTGPRRLDGTNNGSARAELMWIPTSDFSARLNLEYQKEQDGGPAFYLLGSADPNVVLPADFQLGADDPNKHQTYATVGTNKFEFYGATLLTDWSVGGGDLKGTLAFDKTSLFTDIADGTPLRWGPNAQNAHSSQEFGELIYTSNPQKPLTVTVGVNAYHANEFLGYTITVFFLPFPLLTGGDVETSSYAAFAHAQYAFDFGLKVFGGVRVTDDEKRSNEYNLFLGTLAQHHSWVQATYEVGASYDFTHSVSGYVKYATGYKSGGFSAGSLIPPFNPETDQMVEAGLKGTYFSGRLEANLAVFHTSYNDLQVNQVVGLIAQVTNAAKATINGVELETVERITPSLRLQISGGYLDAHFDSFETVDSARPELGLLNLAGNLLPLAPHWTTDAAAYYDLPISGPGKLTAGAEFNWKSKTYFSEFNIPISSQGAVGRLNLSLNYQGPDQRWSVGAYARNVTNAAVKNDVLVISALVDSLAFARLDPGREVGVSFHYKY